MIVIPDIERIAATAEKLGCECLFDEPLKKYTTFRIGGPCRLLVKVNSAESSAKLKALCEECGVRYFVLGNGSNLLVDDDGFDGVALYLGKEMSSLRLVGEDCIYAEAGATLASLCSFALENSLTGLEFAWGIPGSVGGAVYMNAGAYGGEIKDVIVSCDYADHDCVLKSAQKDELDLSYRHSIFMGNERVITGALFRLEKGDKTEIRARMDELMSRRRDKQPLEYGSAGSTFKRPEGSYASLLIDQCGLKGMSVGDAEVSTKHAGFVVNKGNATFHDVMELVDKIIDIVKEKTGYTLECEPEIISEHIKGGV